MISSIDQFLKKISDLPNWLNWVLLRINVFKKHVYGARYKRFKRNLKNTCLVEKLLLESVCFSIQNVPFYRSRYLPVKSIDDFIRKFKFITKEIVIDNYELFISDSINRNLYYEGTTGGTSGKPLRLIIPKNRYIIELAYVHSFWQRVGWNYNPRGVIRNHKLASDQLYKINPVTKEIIFDAFRLDHKYVKIIHGILKRNNINYIQSYPSSAYLFCKLCRDLNLELSFVKAFLTSSEPVLDFQRELITNQLGMKLFSFYGHSEKLVIGGYCEKSINIHFESGYGFTELINENGNPINVAGEVGEIVGSTYYNRGMPLIRYKTGDFAEYVSSECPYCGRKGLIVKNIHGHWDKNLIYKNDETYISTTALNLHSDLYLYIDGLQYIQDRKGLLTILLIKNNQFRDEHYQRYYKHFKEAMGPDNEIEIRFVHKLIQNSNGKFSVLISKIQ
jgi:phenylacetate-CoA ligase